MSLLWIILGLVLLTAGAETLVRGATGLARAARLPSLVIGLTIVAFGTSAPELAVSVKAALAGEAEIAIGNVVGSNVFNVLFILGVSAVIVPLVASSQLVRLDVPVMIGVSALMWILSANGTIGQLEGVMLLAGCVVYTAWLINLGKRTARVAELPANEKAAEAHKARPLVISVVLTVGGLALLVVGARWLVHGATDLARWLGVGELVIGLTIVAAGTSMPEVVTSIVAAIRGERDIAIGNVVGSNIFNILTVLGATAAVASDGVAVAPAALRFDIPVMTAVALICLPIFFTGGCISRWEGLLLLGLYTGYVIFLILSANRPAALSAFHAAMIWFVTPIATLGIALSVLAWVRRRDRAGVSPAGDSGRRAPTESG